MALKVKEGTILLSPESLLCIEKNGKKTLIYTGQDTHECNYNLNELESLLPEQFARVHNSYIVNLTKIRMIKYTNSRNYQVLIDGCPAIAYMSRKKYEEYKHLFSPVIGSLNIHS